MMCGSTERPETLDTQEFRFKRGDRVRATRDNNSVKAGWVGTYDDAPGDGIPYVDWDGQGVLISAEDALEAEPVAEPAPAVPKVGDTVELLEDYNGLEAGARGTVLRTRKALSSDDLIVTADFGRENQREVGVFGRRLRVVPAQPEPLAAALAHIPPRHVLGTWYDEAPEVSHNAAIAGPEFPVSREATVEVFGEPETEEVEVLNRYAFRPGDVVVTVPSELSLHNEPVVVRREVLAAPEPAKPAPGTFGTAEVYGERVRGFVDEDGEFAYADPKTHAVEWADADDFSDFVADSDALALPDAEELGNVLRDTSAARDDLDTWTEDGELILAELARRARD